MAISTTERTNITKLVVSMFNAAPGAANLTAIEAFYEANSSNMSTLADALAASTLFTSQFTNMTNSQIADAAIANFGLSRNVMLPQEAKLAYDFFKTSLDAGHSLQSLLVTAVSFLAVPANAATYPIASATLANKATVAEYHSVTKALSANTLAELQTVVASVSTTSTSVDTAKTAVDNLNTVTGQTFLLTDGADNLTGTSADDMFLASVVQNTARDGAITNQFATGDVINGGAGTKDELFAKIQEDSFTQSGAVREITADTTGIEIVRLEVIDNAVTVDAGSLNGVKEFWSDDSEGDLTIEDVRLGTGNSVTKDITFGIKDSDHDHNFIASFDSASLTNAGNVTSNSQITIEVAYEALPTGLNAVTEVTKGLYLQVNFTGTKADGTSGAFASGFLSTDGTTYAHTYEGLRALLDATLDAQGFTNLTVTATDALTSITTAAGVKSVVANAYKILVVDPAGNAFSNQSSGTGQTATAGVSSSDVAANIYTTAPTTSTTLIESNLVLDNAGRSSTMGNVTIGGDSNSDKGVEQFNIFVDRSSAIATLTTSDLELQKVVISSTGSTLKTTIDGNGDLEINSITGWDHGTATTGQVTTSIDATAFKGANLMLGDTVELTGVVGNIEDVNIINANTTANVTLFASTTGGTVADTDEAYTVTTGSGADKVTYKLDGDNVDAEGESFTLTTNAGNDTIVLSSDTTGDVSQNTMKILANLSIDSGAGADTITLNSYQNFNINAGADSDYVRIDSVNDNGNATTGTVTVGSTTGTQTWGNAGRVLYNAKATVTFAGIESTVTITTTSANNFVAKQIDINTAIKNAIAASPELSKLLTTTDVTGTEAMTIASTIGGDNDLSIDIWQPQLIATGTATAVQTLISSTDVEALRKGLLATETVATLSAELENAAEIVTWTDASADFYGSIAQNNAGNKAVGLARELAHNKGDESITKLMADGAYNYLNATAFGTDATVGVNFSTINLGDGANDLLVLHSNDLSMNTIKIDGSFGKNTIINFFDIEAGLADQNKANVGLHQIDFTAILTNTTDTSTSTVSNTDSAKAVTVTLHDNANTYTTGATASADVNATANSVNVLHYNESVAATSVKFADFTAAQLLAKLNDQTTTGATGTILGGLAHDSLTIVATANLVGTTQYHIFMVENEANLGEYKVFKATSELNTAKTATASGVDDFTSVDFLGTLDFGHSVNFNLVSAPSAGATTASTMLANLMASADTGSSVTVDGVAQSIVTAANEGTAATTVATTQTITAGGMVTNAAGASVEDSTITLVKSGVTLTGTAAQLTTLSGTAHLGALTVSDATAVVADVNTIAGKTTGVVTATVATGTAAALNSAMTNGSTTDMLTFTTTDATAAASDLTGLDGKTAVTVNAAAVVANAITGTVAEMVALAGATGVTTAANYVGTISDAAGTAVTAANLATIGGDTTGVVTVTNNLVISGTTAQAIAALVTAGTEVINNGGDTITLSDFATTDLGNQTTGRVTHTVAGTETNVAITNFATGTDKINVDALTTATSATTLTGAITPAANTVYFVSADFNDSMGTIDAALATALSNQAVIAASTATAYIVAVDTGATDGTADSAIYKWVDTGDNEIAAAELTLVGTINGALVVGDLLFA